MTERNWIYEILSEEFGPVSAQEIDELVTQGTLSADDRVRPANAETWLTVDDLRRSGAFDVEAEEISDLSELSFSFEDGDYDERADLSPGLDIDSFNLQGDSDSPLPEAAGQHHRPAFDNDDEPEADYFVESLGQVLGPMPLYEVIMMADAGTLSPGDRVRAGDEDWQTADDIPELAAAFVTFEDSSETPEPRADAAEIQETCSEDAPATDSSEPTKKRGRKKKAGTAKSSAGRGRKKRKRRKKKDEALEAIFSEIFTNEGKLRDDLQPTAGNTSADGNSAPTSGATPVASQPASPVDAAMAGTASAESGAPGQPMSPPVMSPPPMAAPPMGMAGASPGMAGNAAGMGGMGGAMPGMAARPPMPTPRKKKKSSSFQMPEPKVLGIIAGVVVAILILVGGFTGIIPLPGFGPSGKAVIEQAVAEYAENGGPSMSEAEWKEFQKRTRVSVVAVNKSLMGGSLSEHEMKIRYAITKLGAFVSMPYAEKDARAEALTAVKAAMKDL